MIVYLLAVLFAILLLLNVMDTKALIRELEAYNMPLPPEEEVEQENEDENDENDENDEDENETEQENDDSSEESYSTSDDEESKEAKESAEEDMDISEEEVIDEDEWYEIPEQTENQKNKAIIKEWLYMVQKKGITKRSQLKDYLHIFGGDMVKRELSPIRHALREMGWLAIDPWYSDEDADLDLSDEAISKALENLEIEYNREWCNILVKGFPLRPQSKNNE